MIIREGNSEKTVCLNKIKRNYLKDWREDKKIFCG